MKKSKRNIKTNFLPILTFVLIGVFFYFSITYTPKWSYNWSGIRLELKDSILKLDDENGLTGKYTGYDGGTPLQWHRQNWILENATSKELQKLTEHPSGTVKAIAYQGLLENHNINKYELLNKSLNDSLSFVFHTDGCLSHPYMLSEYNIKYILQLEDSTYNKDLGLTLTQKNEILTKFNKMKLKEKYFIEEFKKTIE